MSSHFIAKVVENRGTNEHHGKGGHEKSRERSKSHPKGLSCYYCGKLDHKKSECKFLKRDQKAGTVHANQIDSMKKTKVKPLLPWHQMMRMFFLSIMKII